MDRRRHKVPQSRNAIWGRGVGLALPQHPSSHLLPLPKLSPGPRLHSPSSPRVSVSVVFYFCLPQSFLTINLIYSVSGNFLFLSLHFAPICIFCAVCFYCYGSLDGLDCCIYSVYRVIHSHTYMTQAQI